MRIFSKYLTVTLWLIKQFKMLFKANYCILKKSTSLLPWPCTIFIFFSKNLCIFFWYGLRKLCVFCISKCYTIWDWELLKKITFWQLLLWFFFCRIFFLIIPCNMLFLLHTWYKQESWCTLKVKYIKIFSSK